MNFSTVSKDKPDILRMFSGSDSTESQNYTQWALNPSAYQNVSSEQVDWAALAQQWIIMKEANAPVPEQATAPPLHSNVAGKKKREVVSEAGEAPMEMDNEKDDEPVLPPWNNTRNSGPPPPGDAWGWNQQQQWGSWNNSWSGPPSGPPPIIPKAPLLPTPPNFNQFNANDAATDNSTFGSFTNTTQNDYSSGYWSTGNSSKQKPHNKRYSKVNVPRQPPIAPEPLPTVTLDAAKRKQLPAWIREGLEKMERDKQKQLEKEREMQEKESQGQKMKLSEKDTMEIIKSTVRETRSKYENEGYESDDSEFRGRALTPEPVPLTQEELMLKVRRTMTEILLNVTNREISQICREELQRHTRKSKASDQRVSAPSGSNLSARLGLGIYGGDSESSAEDSDSESRHDRRDSDSELKEMIRKRKAEFQKTERDIEDRLADAEKKTTDDRASSSETNDNDSQVDAKYQERRPKTSHGEPEGTPPPKKNSHHDTKQRRRSSSSSGGSTPARRSDRNRRSSSSDSERSDRHKKSKSSIQDRTPDRHRDLKTKHKSSKRSRSRSKSRRDSRHSRRSRSRSRRRSHKSSRNNRSRSRSRSSRRSGSRSSYRYRRSRSRRRSDSSGRRSSYRRRSRSSSSSGRGKRSHRH